MLAPGGAPQCRVPDTSALALTRLATPQARLPLLRASAWFAAQPEDLQDWLCRHARPLAFAAGQRVFVRGGTPAGLYCVISGAVRVTASSASGREALLAMAEAPLWFGEAALFDGLRHSHDAFAQGDVVLLHIAMPALHDFLAQRPQHWRAFGLLLAQKLRLAFEGLEGAALLPPATRLARRLVVIAEGYGDAKGSSKRVIGMQQDQLGSMLSLSRQTVNQILRNFEARGLLRCTRGAIQILDYPQLKRFADAEDDRDG